MTDRQRLKMNLVFVPLLLLAVIGACTLLHLELGWFTPSDTPPGVDTGDSSLGAGWQFVVAVVGAIALYVKLSVAVEEWWDDARRTGHADGERWERERAEREAI